MKCNALFGCLDVAFEEQLLASFENLPDDHLSYHSAKTAPRKRRHTTYCLTESSFREAPEGAELFNQRMSFHVSYGGLHNVAPISWPLSESYVLEDLLRKIVERVPSLSARSIYIGVDQLRIYAHRDLPSGNAPPYLHQDGFDYKGDLEVRRENVLGGATLISTTELDSDIFFSKELAPGEFAILDDRSLFHGATGYVPKNVDGVAFSDLFILNFIVNR